uniref:Uncharacterized protein n=1 Tax=Oryza punctata TaxID=4537 RepID=A0A0E0L3C5_ORYPU
MVVEDMIEDPRDKCIRLLKRMHVDLAVLVASMRAEHAPNQRCTELKADLVVAPHAVVPSLWAASVVKQEEAARQKMASVMWGRHYHRRSKNIQGS